MIGKELWLAKDKAHKVELKNNSMNEKMKKQEIDFKQITKKIKLLQKNIWELVHDPLCTQEELEAMEEDITTLSMKVKVTYMLLLPNGKI